MFKTTQIYFNGKVKTDQHKTLKNASRKAWDDLRNNNSREVVITHKGAFIAGIARRNDGVQDVVRESTLTHSLLI